MKIQAALPRRLASILAREFNPILVKELRSRFRGPRAFTVLTAFLTVISLWAFFMYFSNTVSQYSYYSGGGYYNANRAAQIGEGDLHRDHLHRIGLYGVYCTCADLQCNLR